MNKKIIWYILGAIVVGFIVVVIYQQRGSSQPVQNSQGKIKVAASFYPLADFARHVGGDLVSVVNITPAGAEPHDYEPTPQDIAAVYDSKLFIFNGNGVDAWGDKIQADLESKGVRTIKMNEHIESLQNNSPAGSEGAAAGAYDPHFWLDPVNAEKEADAIANALISVDASHQEIYVRNRDAFKAQLALLDQQYAAGLSSCQLRTIVTSHNAFNYLANRYNLSTLYILGLSADQDPSPKTIADVADAARARGIKYIFFETLISPKLATTIATEIGAQTLVLNPIEGLSNEEIAAGNDYISEMKNNLANLRIALSCR